MAGWNWLESSARARGKPEIASLAEARNFHQELAWYQQWRKYHLVSPLPAFVASQKEEANASVFGRSDRVVRCGRCIHRAVSFRSLTAASDMQLLRFDRFLLERRARSAKRLWIEIIALTIASALLIVLFDLWLASKLSPETLGSVLTWGTRLDSD